MQRWLERRFALEAHGTDLKRELIGGATTYVALAYILVVQPIVLSAAGMDFGAVLTATALGSALACFVMGFYANYPVALAPAMGHNFYFAFAVVLGMGIGWQAALTATFIAGLLFVALTLAGVRRKILEALPASLMNAFGVGIGLLIALVGLEWAGIIAAAPGTLVGLGDLGTAPVLLSLAGLALLGILTVLRVPGAMLIGMVVTAAAGVLSGVLEFRGVVSAPPSPAPTAFHLDFSLLFRLEFWIVVAVFLFLDLFDTIGTLVGIAPEAGMMKDGKVAVDDKALLADGGGTVAGALLGTSTITAYVESAAGIRSGARTGLAAVVTGVLLLLSPLCYPLIQTIAGGVAVSQDVTLYPVTAPVLILIGVMMMKRVSAIEWENPAEAIPAFLTIAVMMLSVSITEGIAFGVIGYSLLSFADRRARAHPVVHLLALILLARYVFLV